MTRAERLTFLRSRFGAPPPAGPAELEPPVTVTLAAEDVRFLERTLARAMDAHVLVGRARRRARLLADQLAEGRRR